MKKTATLWQQQAYVLPTISTSFIVGSLTIVQGMYAKYFGLSLETIAAIIFISRLFDAVTDPIIGFYSDRNYRRTSSRKLFVVVGGLLFIVSSYFLYTPVELETLHAIENGDVETTDYISAEYFLGWYLVFYFSWTLFEIPHLAWGRELSSTSQGSMKIYSLRAASMWLGILLFYSVPLFPFFETQAFTPKTLYWAVLGASFLMLPFLYLCIKNTPDNVCSNVELDHSNPKEPLNLTAIGQEVLVNKPLLIILTVIMLFNFSVSGMWLTLLFIFSDTYLLLGERFAQLSLIGLSAGIPMMVVWCWLARYWSKKMALVLGLLLSLIGTLGTGLLNPGETSFFPLALVLIVCFGMGSPAVNCLAPSILADIIDYGSWKFGRSNGATYFSLYTLLGKAAAGIGGAVGFVIAGFYGFDPSSLTQSEESIFGLRMAIAWLPAGMVLLAVFFLLRYPFSAQHHSIIRRRLEGIKLRS